MDYPYLKQNPFAINIGPWYLINRNKYSGTTMRLNCFFFTRKRMNMERVENKLKRNSDLPVRLNYIQREIDDAIFFFYSDTILHLKETCLEF